MKHIITVWKVSYNNKYGTRNNFSFEGKKAAENFFNSLPDGRDATIEEGTEEVFITKKMKTEYQKLLKEIRTRVFERTTDHSGNCEYPKPMMTASQMIKGQATVNCGGEWYKADTTKKIAEQVLEDEAFKAWIGKYEANARLEAMRNGGYQIRIQF